MTNLPDLDSLSMTLQTRFRIAFLVKSGESDGGSFIEVRPKELEKNQGFVVRTTIGWSSISSHMSLEDYSADLLREMSKATEDQRKDFVEWARASTDENAVIRLKINDSVMSLFDPVNWPREWTAFEIEAEEAPVMLNHSDAPQIGAAVLSWTSRLLAMAISLIPLEEVETAKQTSGVGIPEGRARRAEVNVYERNRLNRKICISVRGTNCVACGFDFLARYGEIGRDFIHVHHVVPVSKLDDSYRLNPADDLVPVCPNCHAMIHRRDPPFEIGDIKRFLSLQKVN